MTLDEQLHELRVNLLRDTSYLLPGSEDDRMFPDAVLIRYIEDAERRFARQTLCLRDAITPAVTQVILKEGVKDYKLHRSVISVLSAKISTQSVDLVRAGHWVINTPYPQDQDAPFDSAMLGSAQTGVPRAFYTDETTVYVQTGVATATFWPVPSAAAEDTVVQLRVIRTPICAYNLQSLERESEIPLDYQLDVLEWAAYRAKRNFDVDAGADGGTSAADHKAAFDEAVIRANKEINRRIFAPTRLDYGANGFSW